MYLYIYLTLWECFYSIQTYLYKFFHEIFAGLFSIRKHILLLHEDPITAKEFLIGPSAIFMLIREDGYIICICPCITHIYNCVYNCPTQLPCALYQMLLLIFYLDGKPAAEIRIVSRMPHARSCCTALTGSKLYDR